MSSPSFSSLNVERSWLMYASIMLSHFLLKKPPDETMAFDSSEPKDDGMGLEGVVSHDKRYSGFRGFLKSLRPRIGSPAISVRPDTEDPTAGLFSFFSQLSKISGWDSI